MGMAHLASPGGSSQPFSLWWPVGCAGTVPLPVPVSPSLYSTAGPAVMVHCGDLMALLPAWLLTCDGKPGADGRVSFVCLF